MKKKILKRLIIFVLAIIIIIVIILFFIKSNAEILADEYYYNNAWGFQYYGTVICKDGRVYEYELDSSEYNSTNVSKLILNSITEYLGKIDNENLEKIKEYSSYIDNNFESESSSLQLYDVGESGIRIWNSKNNAITLSKYDGMKNTYNTSQYADELKELITECLNNLQKE